MFKKQQLVAPCSIPLIPGIPDDVVLDHILTKVSWKCFFVLPAVNGRWREEFRSRRVYKHRRSTGTDQPLIAVIHKSDPLQLVLSLFTLSEKNEWLRLPRIPWVPGGVPRGCGLVFLEGILYIIGGYDSQADRNGVSDPSPSDLFTFHSKKTVYELDIAAGRGVWRTGVPMEMDIGDVLCKVEEGRIHTAKYNVMDRDPYNVMNRDPRWEMNVYDPVSKSWTQAFDLRQSSARSFDSCDKRSFYDETIWDLRTDFWWTCRRRMALVRNTRARVNGSLYSVSAEGVSVRDSSSGEWHLHSVSFRDYVRSLGRDDDFHCWDVVPLDGELVVTVSWPRRSLVRSRGSLMYKFEHPSDFIFGLVMSRGLGSGEHSVAWNMIQFPDRLGWRRSFSNEGCNERTGSFPDFFSSYPPQVYPCKL